MNPPTFISAFSGQGGFEKALEDSGWRCTDQIEIEPAPLAVLRRHFPHARRHRDIKDVDPADLPRVDLICGGSPCTDLSVAGRRAGLAGEHSGLVYELIRLADALAPPWFLFENVPGLYTSNKGEDLAVLLELITGFRPAVPRGGWRNSGVCVGPKRAAAWSMLDAQYRGLAQRRDRVFIVGHTGNPARPAEILFEPTSGLGHPPPRRQARQGAAPTSPGRTRSGGGWPAEVAPTLGTGWADRSAGSQAQDWDAQKGGLFVPDISYALTARASMDRPESGAATLVAAPDSESYIIDGQNAASVPQVGALATGAAHHNRGFMVAAPVALHLTQTPVSSEEVAPTLSSGGSQATVGIAIPLLEVNARTNPDGSNSGHGIGDDGDPMFTLQAGKQHGIAIPIDMRNATRATDRDEQNRQGVGIGEDADPAPTITNSFTPAVAYAFDWQKGNDVTNPRPSTMNVSEEQTPTLGSTRVPAVAIRTAQTGVNGHGVADDIAHTLDTLQGQAVAFAPDASPALRAEGHDASEDGASRRALIAFSSKDFGGDATEDLSPTLRAQNFDQSHINGGGQVAIAYGLSNQPTPKFGEDVAPTLDAKASGGGRMEVVAFAENQQGKVREMDIANSLNSGGGKPGQGYPAIAFTERTRKDGASLEWQEEQAYALLNPGAGARTPSRNIAAAMAVRRLTPTETMRLMGFPDDWTEWGLDEQGNRIEISDSARYRMIGNSVAVPVVAWIARRLLAAHLALIAPQGQTDFLGFWQGDFGTHTPITKEQE